MIAAALKLDRTINEGSLRTASQQSSTFGSYFWEYL